MKRALFAACLILMAVGCRKTAGSLDLHDPPHARAFYSLPGGWRDDGNSAGGTLGLAILTHAASNARIGVYLEPADMDFGKQIFDSWVSRASGWYGTFQSAEHAKTERGYHLIVFMVGPATLDLLDDFNTVVDSARVAIPN